MKIIFLIVLSLGLFASPGFSEEDGRVLYLLPAFSPAVVFTVDEEGNKIRLQPERAGKFAELYVRPRLNPDNPEELYIPNNFYEAVRELKLMLPPEYHGFILAKYGYVKPTEEDKVYRKFTRGFDDRILDLSGFLNGIWQLSKKNQLLTKQIECMGNFEFDMTALFIFLVIQETLDEGGYYSEDIREAVYLAHRLEVACLAE